MDKYKTPKEITTDRLLLRRFKNDDWFALHKYYSHSDAVKYTTGRAYTEGETWRAMATMIGHWEIHGYGPYGITLKENNALIGICGFWYPNDWPEPEIKWALNPEYWGKGYASEATRAVQKVARKSFEKSMISFIHSENKGSIKLALAVGAILGLGPKFGHGEKKEVA